MDVKLEKLYTPKRFLTVPHPERKKMSRREFLKRGGAAFFYYLLRTTTPLGAISQILSACADLPPQTLQKTPETVGLPARVKLPSFTQVLYGGVSIPKQLTLKWGEKSQTIRFEQLFDMAQMRQLREKSQRENVITSTSVLLAEPQETPPQLGCQIPPSLFLTPEQLARKRLKIVQSREVHLHVLPKAFEPGAVFQGVSPERPLEIVLVDGDRVAPCYLPPERFKKVWERMLWPIDRKEELMSPSSTERVRKIIADAKNTTETISAQLLETIPGKQRILKDTSKKAWEVFSEFYSLFLLSLVEYHTFVNFSEADWFSYLSGGVVIFGIYRPPEVERGEKEGLILFATQPYLNRKVVITFFGPQGEVVVLATDLFPPFSDDAYSLGALYSPSIVAERSMRRTQYIGGYIVGGALPLQFVALHEIAHHDQRLEEKDSKDLKVRVESERSADMSALKRLRKLWKEWQEEGTQALEKEAQIVFEDVRTQRCLYADQNREIDKL